MNELSQRARAFVDAAREAEGVAGPSPAERIQLRTRLRNLGHDEAIRGELEPPHADRLTHRNRLTHPGGRRIPAWMRSLAAGLVVAAVKGSAPAWAAAGFWLATGAVVGVGVVGALVAPRLASSTDQQAPSLAPGGSRGNTSWPAPTGPNRAVTTEPIATPSAAVSVGGPPTAEPAASAPLVRGRRPVPPESGLSMGLARETSLVRAAQEAIVRGRASLALELLDEYEQRFPRGGLAVEAAAIRVLAICTQNPAEGRVLAEEFASKWPGSPLLARIGATCGVSR